MEINSFLEGNVLLIDPSQQAWVDDCLSNLNSLKDEIASLNQDSFEESAGSFWHHDDGSARHARPYQVVDGSLIVPVHGALLNKFTRAYSFATGYDYINAAIQRGVEDSSVEQIVLHINSPGGMVSGCFDLTDKIAEAGSKKEIIAACDEHAYSAAYSIASACSKIVVPRTGGVGSIGVVTSHVSFEGAMEQQGVKVTFIHAGKHKVDGNSYQDLPEDVKAKMQKRIDSMYQIFVESVSRNRGLSIEKVRGTEADVYTASEAVEMGLADEVASFDNFMAALVASNSKTEVSVMSKNNQNQPEADNNSGFSQDQVDAAVNSAVASAVAGERDRIRAVMGSDAAKGREEAALEMALSMDASADVIGKVLAKIPAAKESAGSSFEDAMAKNNPDVGASVPEDSSEPSSDDQAAALLGSYF